jgi:hypothetical protein
MRATTRNLILSSVFALATTLASPAHADVETARQLFAEGVKVFQRGDYEGARRLFRKADAEHHAPPIVYNIGLAEERGGHPQAAVEAYEAYIAEAGDGGEYTQAAVIAIAQVKARSTRLRIETKPPGARLFVDATTLTEPSPTTFLVTPGHHVVVAQGDGWRTEQELDVKGSGDAASIVLASEGISAPPPPVLPAPTKAPVVEKDQAPVLPAPPPSQHPEGWVWGAAFTLVPYQLTAATDGQPMNDRKVTQAMAGAVVEVGRALTERFEFMARSLLAVGPNGSPTTAWTVGPALSYRVASPLWIGATFVGGQLATKHDDDRFKQVRADGTVVKDSTNVRYGTGPVFGAMAEVTLALFANELGQWTVGLQPGLLLTDQPRDNTAYFVPLTFGFRAY